MANYNIVVDTSNFKPYDFSDLAAMFKQVYNVRKDTEDQIYKIREEQGKYILPSETNYGQLQSKFWEDMDKASESYYSTHNRDSINAIKRMRQRYASEMIPINNIVEKYNNNVDLITKAGDDAIIGNRDQLLNIDTYQPGVKTPVLIRSSKTIMTTAAAAMKSLNNALMGSPELASKIANQYLSLKLSGIDGREALNLILKFTPSLNSAEGIADADELVSTLDSIYKQYAFDEGTPENSKVLENVINGAILGIQAPSYTIQQDRSADIAAAREQREYYKNQRDYLKDLNDAKLRKLMLELGYVKNENGEYIQDIETAKQILSLTKGKYPRNPSKLPEPKVPTGAQTFSYGDARYAFKANSKTYGRKSYTFYEYIDNPSGAIWEPIDINSSLHKELLEYILNYTSGKIDESAGNEPLDPDENNQEDEGKDGDTVGSLGF